MQRVLYFFAGRLPSINTTERLSTSSQPMSAKTSTKVTVCRAIQLCFMAIFAPGRFAEAEASDNAVLNAAQNVPPEAPVLKGQAGTAQFAATCSTGGCCRLWSPCRAQWVGPACPSTVSLLHTVGALILLWATLAVRGWDVLTYASLPLTERVNQWMYRFLYCCGSAVLVWSSFWEKLHMWLTFHSRGRYRRASECKR